jgi:hypothetical protein
MVMSILWVTTALGVAMLLSAAVIGGTLAVGLVACLLSRGVEWLLGLQVPARPIPADLLLSRPSRSRCRQQQSWTLSA